MIFKRALVTGASGGIGRALCKLLAKQGISLILVARNEEEMKNLADELKDAVEVHIVPADLSDRLQRQRVVQAIHAYAPDLVVNNAGWGYYGEALSYDTSVSMNVLEVDVGALLELTLEAARTLATHSKKGVVMNISSAAAFQIFPDFSVYAASKAFVNTFSESFNEEMRPYGIHILTSCPGMVHTGFSERASSGEYASSETSSMSVAFAAEEIWKQIQKRQPVRVFDWKYRCATFFTKYLIPKRVVAFAVTRYLAQRRAKKPFIPISK